jgi:uncharacterized repeat protein (TIGR01451 family)
MKTRSTRYPNLISSHRHLLLVIGVFIALVTLATVPLLSTAASYAPSNAASPNSRNLSADNQLTPAIALRGFLTAGSGIALPSLSPALQETIATFAADCTTPKAAFFLGETVCAKTDGVDLNYPGGRWVHWLRQDLSIAHGSSSTTLITQNPQFFSYVPDQTGSWKVSIAETGDPSQTTAVFTVSLAPESIATYEATCNLAQDNFALNPTSVTVCAKADPNFTGTRFIHWIDSQGTAFQTDVVTSGNASATSTMTVAGNYWVYFSDEDGNLRSSHAFTVSDPENPKVDLSVFKNRITSNVVDGGFITYEIVVGNRGPDAASSVVLTDDVPLNVSYSSSTQDSGPAFTRTQETPTTTWTIASLAPGASASFTFVYQVNSPAGTVVTNTAEVDSTTTELHEPDNSSTDSATVVSGTPSGDCTLDCPNDIVTTATTHGEGGGANVTFGAPEGFGNCGTITSDPASGSFFPIGETTVVSTSSTGGGGCSFTVTVVDSAAPTITCPSNITVTANEGQGSAFVPDPNGSSSNVGSPTTTGDQPLEVTGSREDGDGLTTAYPIGTTDITWIATDPSGRQATCTQVITVLPNQVLTITCPPNKTEESPTGCDPATVNPGTPTSNSQTATIIGRRSDNLAYSDNPAFNDPYPVGTTTIEWTATDTDTQTASCTQTITVTGTDQTPPTLHVPPDVSATTSSCTATLDDELGVATAEEDCGTVNISRSGVPTFSCPTPENPNRQCESFVFPTGTTVITYTATNSSGLSTTGMQNVTVTEDPAVNPTITAPDDVTLYTGPGATTCSVTVSNLDATLGTATANDNCPGVTVARSNVPAGNVFPLGNTTVTYTATDKSNNTASDTQVVTVVDNTPPVISCPADITQNTDPGLCSAVVNTGTATATDNCDSNPTVVGTRSDNQPLSAPYPKGTTTITWTATDHATPTANSSSCTQTITVEDKEAPVITTNGVTPVLWPADHSYRTFNVTDFVIAASDNCDTLGVSDVVIDKVTSDETENGGGDGNTFNDIIIAADCKSVQVRAERRNSADGRVYTITFKVTDSSGNVGTKTSTIHVPKNLGVPVVDSGPNYTVMGTCP